MQISYETFQDKKEYQSLLVINEAQRWKETIFFTFYTPWEEEKELLYAGCAMSDVHFKDKPAGCVLAFDFHKWDENTIAKALELDLPPVAFERPIKDLLKLSLEERENKPEGFCLKLKD